MAGVPNSVPGFTMNRFCSSGLQAIALGAQAIMSGMAEVILAGGIESMSRVPGGGNNEMFSGDMLDVNDDVYLGMGLTAERVAEQFNASREDQDVFACESQRRALAAIEHGTFKDEIIPIEIKHRLPGPDGQIVEKTTVAAVDEGARATTMESLAELKPVFKKNGTVTAGNSSPTCDGAGAAVVMTPTGPPSSASSRWPALSRSPPPVATPVVMGIGPVSRSRRR